LLICEENQNRLLKLIRNIASKLYIAWVLFVFTFFMILYLPGILIPFLLGERYGNVSYQFLKLWAWTFSKLNRIPYIIHGKENIHPAKAYIYLSNHTSYLDIPGMCLTVPTQIRPLAKKELLKFPVLGWIIRHASVMVDRTSNESRRKSMEHMKDVLRRGISVLIFPEGTQNRTSEPLQPFYDGAFRIAIETQQPILPMVILGAGKLMPPRRVFIQPGTVRIYIGPEIPTQGMAFADLPVLKEKVRQKMLAMIGLESEINQKAQSHA
jgi:1-acyl-sn-glycerol-3-phosphate acyltransferase